MLGNSAQQRGEHVISLDIRENRGTRRRRAAVLHRRRQLGPLDQGADDLRRLAAVFVGACFGAPCIPVTRSRIRVEPSGAINASAGIMASGQGYETVFAQAVAEGLGDYLLPTACEVPAIELLAKHTPNRRTPAGIKGMAEGGVMGATGAIGNAVNDALAPLGVAATSQPFSPDRLRLLLRKQS
jgi:CO/xanthine dehydrogenase Mo-binding subunit